MYDRTDTAAVKEISVISNQNAKVQLCFMSINL